MKSVAKKIKGLTYREEAMRKEMDAQRSREHPNGLYHRMRQLTESKWERQMQAGEVAQSRAKRSARRLAKKPLVTQARRERKLEKKMRTAVRGRRFEDVVGLISNNGVVVL